MSAIALFHEDGKPAGIWYCSECRVVHAEEARAIRCHGTLTCACGSPVEIRYSSQCNACDCAAWSERMRTQEAARFEKAQKIPAVDYGGPVYADGVGPEWFETLDEYFEYVEDDDAAIAAYLWATKNVGVRRVSTEDLTESLFDGMWEDADESDLNGIPELAEALDAFNEANKSVRVWNIDYTRAIVGIAERKAA
jgi:hypothetical protein